MTRHYVEVEVDLYDFNDDELLDELRRRKVAVHHEDDDGVEKALLELRRGQIRYAIELLEHHLSRPKWNDARVCKADYERATKKDDANGSNSH